MRLILYDRGMVDDSHEPEPLEGEILDSPHSRGSRELVTVGFPSAEELESFSSAKRVHPEETEELAAYRIARESLPEIMQNIVYLAKRASSEKTRLEAARFIVNHTLGLPAPKRTNEKTDPLELFLKEWTSETG
jgi:hypothetical protein